MHKGVWCHLQQHPTSQVLVRLALSLTCRWLKEAVKTLKDYMVRFLTLLWSTMCENIGRLMPCRNPFNQEGNCVDQGHIGNCKLHKKVQLYPSLTQLTYLFDVSLSLLGECLLASLKAVHAALDMQRAWHRVSSKAYAAGGGKVQKCR